MNRFPGFCRPQGALLLAFLLVLAGCGEDETPVETEQLTDMPVVGTAAVPPQLRPANAPNACVALFTNAVQTHASEGQLAFYEDARLSRAPVDVLYSPRVAARADAFHKSCRTRHCRATGVPAPALAGPAFQEVSGSRRFRLAPGQQFTVGESDEASQRNFVRLQAQPGSELTFAPGGDYRIGLLEAGSDSVLRLTAGDYWIDDLRIGPGARLEVAGQGSVRLHLRRQWRLGPRARLNTESADPARLLIVHQGDVTFKAGARAQALVYARGEIRLQNDVQVTGALNAATVILGRGSEVVYDGQAVARADFGLWCDLDGDGTFDGLDDDRDGDGFSNDEERQAGSDPDDPQDIPPGGGSSGGPPDEKPDEDDNPPGPPEGPGSGGGTPPDRTPPDTTPPRLQLNNPDGQQVEAAQVLLTGTLVDPAQPGSGVARFTLTSDAFPGTVLTPQRQGSRFQVEVPLVLGANRLQLEAVDRNGNRTRLSRQIQRIAPPRFLQVQPTNGSTLTEPRVTLTGELRSLLPLEQVQFFIDDWQLVPEATDDPQVYRFELPDVPLQVGLNRFTLRAVNPDGASEQPLRLDYVPSDSVTRPGPSIERLAPATGRLQRAGSLVLKGRVASAVPPVRLTVQGLPVDLVGPPGQGFFQHPVSFAAGSDRLSVAVEATDNLGQRTRRTFTFHRDAKPPRLVLEDGLRPVPAVNPVHSSPFTLRGTVSDPHLASLSAGGQPVALAPGARAGEYRFALPLALAPGAEAPLVLKARDRAGNTTTTEVRLKSEASLGLEWLQPAADTERLLEGDTPTVALALRLSQAPAGVQVTARAGEGPVQPLALDGLLATGELTLPAEAGDQTLEVRAEAADGRLLARSQRRITLVDPKALPLALVSATPAPNQTGVAPGAAIELHFNKPLDPTGLSLSVRETLHGKTWVNVDAPGTDFLRAQGAQLVDVARDQQPVPGETLRLPGDRSLAFFPDRPYGFGAEVFVDVRYQGQDLARHRFQVRPLPTLIIGGLADQFGRPVPDIPVALPELGLATTTNADGAFAFGFGAQAGPPIPGGRQTLLINPGFAHTGYGSERRVLRLDARRRNDLGLLRLPELSPNLPFVAVQSGQPRLVLAGGDLELDLSQARLRFARGRTAGRVQVQFFGHGEFTVPSPRGLAPLWAYGIQPRGIAVDGPVGLRLAIPALNGSRDYILPGMERVVLLGYDPDREQLTPVGIGRIDHQQVVSETPVSLDRLDYLAYSLVAPRYQPLLKDVAEGRTSLLELTAVLGEE